ncbi:MAG: lipopolysaccharide biosynthesis protein [Pseudomonadota bacterium]
MSYLQDTAYNAAAVIVSSIGRLVGMALIARALGVEAFGVLAIAGLCLEIVSRMSLFGLGEVTSRFLALLKDEERPRWQRIQRIWIVLSLATAVTATGITGAFYLESDTSTLAILLFWSVMAVGRSVAEATTLGRFRFDLKLLAGCLEASVMVLGGLFFVQAEDVNSALAVIATSTLGYFLGLLLGVKREGRSALPSAQRPGLPPLRDILLYAANVWVIAFCSILVWSRGELTIGKELLSPEALGHYGAALTLLSMVWYMLAMFESANTPHLSKRASDAASHDHFVRTMTRLMVTISATVAIFLAALGGQVVVLVYGAPFRPAGDVLTVLAPAYAAGGMLLPVLAIQLLSNGRFNRIMLAMAAVGLLALAWTLTPAFGITGIALARTAVFVCIAMAAAVWLIAFRDSGLGLAVLGELCLAIGLTSCVSVVTEFLEPSVTVRAGLCIALCYLLWVRATGAYQPIAMTRSGLNQLRGL